MYSQVSKNRRERTVWICLCAMCLAVLTLATGCFQSTATDDTVTQGTVTEQAAVQELDLSQDGKHTSGDWTYSYSITNAGTRSEGYHGVLSYKQIELPAPMHTNDYYETPWGPLYWVGRPVVPFGSHGWMPKPLAREPVGQALIDPAIAGTERFHVQLKVVTPESLYTPDRMEKDPNVLAVLKAFEVTEAHLQYDWLPLGSDPIRLHDTKRWGTLTVRRSDSSQHLSPTLEFTCTNDLTVETTPKPPSLAELMPAAEFPDKPSWVSLSPEVDALQPIKCTLTSFVGDPLIVYVICRIKDQGATEPSTSPSTIVYEGQRSHPTHP
mgnify:CR=1 FL=1